MNYVNPYQVIADNLRSDMKVLLQDLDRLQAATSWIDATRQVPALGERVLGFSSRDRRAHVVVFDGDWHEGTGVEGWSHQISHWMRLPPAPRTE